MSDIPEDIEQTAWNTWCEAQAAWDRTMGESPDPTPFVARAILAERERCAQIAEQSPQQTAGDRRRAEFIAAAIRSSPERAGE